MWISSIVLTRFSIGRASLLTRPLPLLAVIALGFCIMYVIYVMEFIILLFTAISEKALCRLLASFAVLLARLLMLEVISIARAWWKCILSSSFWLCWFCLTSNASIPYFSNLIAPICWSSFLWSLAQGTPVIVDRKLPKTSKARLLFLLCPFSLYRVSNSLPR